MSVSVALFLTISLNLLDSQKSKDKALDNAFQYIHPHPSASAIGFHFKSKDGDKDSEIISKFQIFNEKSEK